MQYLVTVATRHEPLTNVDGTKRPGHIQFTHIPAHTLHHAEALADAINNAKVSDRYGTGVYSAEVSVRVYTSHKSIILPLIAVEQIADECNLIRDHNRQHVRTKLAGMVAHHETDDEA